MKRLLALVLTCLLCLSPLAQAAQNRLAVCLGTEPFTLDPALNSTVSEASLLAHLFSGLARWEQAPDGSAIIVPDAVTALPEGEIHPDGSATYTYALRPDLRWSDGQPLRAADFEFAWKRAASSALGAPYGYMFEIVRGYPDNLAVEALDGSTLRVTLQSPVPYWNQLLTHPVFYPLREDVAANPAWAGDAASYVSNGPFAMESWAHGEKISLRKNPDHPLANEISLDGLDFHLIEDSRRTLTLYLKGELQFIDDMPLQKLAQLARTHPREYHVVPQPGVYFACFNANQSLLPEDSPLEGNQAALANAEIRRALGLLVDYSYFARMGDLPASCFVAMGIRDTNGGMFFENAGPSDAYAGYWNTAAEAYPENRRQAIELLQKYFDYDAASGRFTNFPTVDYLYNGGSGHLQVAQLLQSNWASLGIGLRLREVAWNSLLRARLEGSYQLLRNGWIADYDDPISFLDMWTSTSGNNDAQLGRGAAAAWEIYNLDLTPFGVGLKIEGGTWAETYDALIAAAKVCTDAPARYAMLHLAEDMLMSTGCVLPLYCYSDFYMLDWRVQGFFSNPMGGKFFLHCTNP